MITILLFLTIPLSQKEALANKSLIIQVIIIMALVMMFGLMFNSKKQEEDQLNAKKMRQLVLKIKLFRKIFFR